MKNVNKNFFLFLSFSIASLHAMQQFPCADIDVEAEKYYLDMEKDQTPEEKRRDEQFWTESIEAAQMHALEQEEKERSLPQREQIAFIKLTYASQEGNCKEIEEVLTEYPQIINRIDVFDKQTPLHQAAIQGQSNAINLLCTFGGDLKAEDPQGNTPLHLAAAGNHTDAITLLIQRGADINARNAAGNSPILEAVIGKKLQAFLLLKSLGADTSLRNYQGKRLSRTLR